MLGVLLERTSTILRHPPLGVRLDASLGGLCCCLAACTPDPLGSRSSSPLNGLGGPPVGRCNNDDELGRASPSSVVSCWFSPAAPLQGFKDDDRDDDDHLPAPFGFRSSAPLGGCGRADDRDDNDRLPAPFGFRSSAPLGGCGCGLPVGGRCAEKELSRACWNEPQLCQYCPFLGLPLRFRPWTSLGGCSGDDDVDERGAGTGGLLCEEVTAANDTRAYQACVLCPGFFGEICAFHAMDHPFGQHTGGLRGAEGPGWSKGPRTSPGTHAATRSADLEFCMSFLQPTFPFLGCKLMLF